MTINKSLFQSLQCTPSTGHSVVGSSGAPTDATQHPARRTSSSSEDTRPRRESIELQELPAGQPASGSEIEPPTLVARGTRGPNHGRKGPKRSALVASSPCEHEAAHIRNEAAKSILNGDLAGVANRLTQSREGMKGVRTDALKYAVMTLIPPGGTVIGIGGIAIDAGNYTRYRATVRRCKEYLSAQGFGDAAKELESFRFSELESRRTRMIRLAAILTKHGIDPASIQDSPRGDQGQSSHGNHEATSE